MEHQPGSRTGLAADTSRILNRSNTRSAKMETDIHGLLAGRSQDEQIAILGREHERAEVVKAKLLEERRRLKARLKELRAKLKARSV